MEDYCQFANAKKRNRPNLKAELDHYLDDDTIEWTPSFDILTWWKVNAGKYANLARIAKDI